MLKLTHCHPCFAGSHLGASSRGSGLTNPLELLGGLKYPAQLVTLLCVGVVICRQDGAKDARAGILEFGSRIHPNKQLVERVAESPENQLDLPGAARDIIIFVVRIPDR